MFRFLLLSFLLFSGCAGPLVCRHTVVAQAAYCEEQKIPYEIIVYLDNPVISLGLYNAHTQVLAGGLYVANGITDWQTFGLRGEPDYRKGSWEGRYDLAEYLRLLKKGCFDRADCRNEGLPQ